MTEPVETDDRVVADQMPAPRGPRQVPAVAFVAAVMVAAVLGIIAVIALMGGGDNDEDARTARLAAGRFGERFLTFEHDRLDDWKADVLALSTGGFAQEVEEVEAGLRRVIGEAELDATTEVTDIFISEIDRGSVQAVLVYDRSVIGETTRTETDRYVQLDMVLVDGTWLVDSVIDIASAGGLGSVAADPTGSSTPSTAGG